MKIFTLSILSILGLLVSCKRMVKSKTTNEVSIIESNGFGDTVNQLGVHLWYIFQDQKNNYWFGSNGEGVYCYNGEIIVNFTTKHGLCSDSIRHIQEDKYGNIYFSTLNGINKFDGKKITVLHAIESEEWKLHPDDLWFSMLGKKNENGPYRYDGKTLYHLKFPKHYLHDELFKSGINPFFSPYEVYCIYKDRKGAMWFGTSVFGACRFDGKSIKWMYERDLTIVPAGGTFGIRSIFEDRNGSFWLCNTSQRFNFDFDKTNQSDRLQYQKTSGIGDAKTFGGDECIYYSYIVEDKDGDIWLTTWDQGVYKYIPSNHVGTNINHYLIKEGSKIVNLVSMYKDHQDGLWLGTNENGVYKFNGNSFERFVP